MIVGKVKHYYDKIGVAIIEVLAEINVGDKVRVTRGGEEMFEQEIVSMQVDHQEIKKAVKEGAEIFKL